MPDDGFIEQLKAALADPDIRAALKDELGTPPAPPDQASLDQQVQQAETEAARALATTAKEPYTPDFSGNVSFNGQTFTFVTGETRDYPIIVLQYIQQQRAERARMEAAHAQLADKNVFLGGR